MVAPDVGCVASFSGRLWHGGNAITSGYRYIIPLFIYLDANGSGKRPGYMLSSLGLEPPEGSDALSRYADAVGAARS